MAMDPYYTDAQTYRSTPATDGSPDSQLIMSDQRRADLNVVKTLGMVTYTSGVRKYSGGMDSCGGIC